MRKSWQTRKKLSHFIILTGIVLVAIALIMEVQSYPWSTIFGASEDASTLPDPKPIILVTDNASNQSQISKDENSNTLEQEEVEFTENSVLPGEETHDTALSNFVSLGIIKIPKLEVSQHILEGTKQEMNYGVGHVIETAKIGSNGNCVIAGHRSKAFRYLDKIQTGDKIVLYDEENSFNYLVYDSFEVLPEETWVLSEIEGETHVLTLITCTPYVISSHRLIVRARLTEINEIPIEEYLQNEIIG